MKTFMRLILTFVLFFAPLASVSAAENLMESETRHVQLSAGEVVEGDYIQGGETVDVSGDVGGDIIIGGGQVIINGDTAGDVLAGGGMINIGGDVAQDIRVAGGQITFSGDVLRNVTVAGGNIEFTPDSHVYGNVTIGAGNVQLGGTIDGDVLAGVGNLTISGTVGGSVQAGVGNMQITSSANVLGDVTYWSEEDGQIADDAVVGAVTKKALPFNMDSFTEFGKNEELQNKFNSFISKARISVLVLKFLTMVFVGTLLIRLAPRFMKQSAEMVGSDPWKGLGVGFLVLLVTPLAALVLLTTVIGIPISLFVMMMYGVLIYVGKFTVIYWAGLTLLKQFKVTNRRGWAFVTGAVVYVLLTNIRFVGGFASMLAVLIGSGVYVQMKKKVFDEIKKKNLV